MECLNCEEVKLDNKYVCKKCKLKLCRYCEERRCEFCDENYCRVCTTYLSEGAHRLCRSCLAAAAERYIEEMEK